MAPVPRSTPPRITRRAALAAAAVGLAPLGLAAVTGSRTAPAPSVGDAALAGPLGDVWIGAPPAKVRLIAYAAVTCTHCAAFHARTWPTLKARWVDTGQLRFALRGFALSPLDTAGFMLARAGDDRHYYAITDLLFEKQALWAFVPEPLDALRDLMRQAGFSRERFEATLNDQALYEAVTLVQTRAASVLGVHATPTFYVNDTRHDGAATAEALGEAIRATSG